MIASALAFTTGAAAQVPAGAQNDAQAEASPPGAETPPAGNQEGGNNEVEEVVVTGSFIRGTPEDAALPVDVVNSEELAQRGSPSQVDLIKSLPISGPVLGDSNQFSTAAQGQVGAGTINLRGLGSLRTLVLLNGRRSVASPGAGSGGVDTNLMPIAAIGRVEILKDGAAATYGSDAIAGVVNFITRKDLEGFEVSADYRFVDGSDGDYGASIAFGHEWDFGDILLAAGYQHRSELNAIDRDWAFQPYTTNPAGWSVLGQPGSFLPVNPAFATPTNPSGAVAGVQRDANCTAVGGYAGFTGATPACYFSYIPFDNLIEDENRYQAYGEVNFEFSDNHRFHGEALYAKTDIPNIRFSPSYPPTSGPNGPGSVGVYSVPITNPGAVTALQQAGLSPGVIAATNRISLTLFRPLGWGGNPSTDGLQGQSGSREYDIFRVGGSFTGDVGFYGLGYDVGLTYSRATSNQVTTDILIDRLQRALNGFGGRNCTGTTPGANGCQYFNPFSNAYARNPALGLTNPGFVQANQNDPALVASLFEGLETDATQSLFVLDAVVNGEIRGFELPGGPIGFAVGAQGRIGEATSTPKLALQDARVTPCPVPGVTTCAVQTGPFIFLGTSVPSANDEQVKAIFTEFNLPFTDAINVQAAIRYEDYGGQTGATTNPKLSGKWQIVDSFAIRGSVGSTFRGPTSGNRSVASVTGLSGIVAASNNFRSVDFFGNPAIGPETADTYNIGAIFEDFGLRVIVDYYNFKIQDQIITTPANPIASAIAAGGTSFANCSSPLRPLITFSNNNTCTQGVTVGNDIARIRSDTVNGPEVRTSGIDATVDYEFPNDVFEGEVTLGGAISYVLEYEQDAFSLNGVPILPGYSAVGFTNYDRFPGTIPEYRANAYVNFNRDIHNVRFTLNYVDEATDNRAPVYVQTASSPTACNATSTNPPCQLITFGQVVESFTSVDGVYRVELPYDATLTASVFNLFDQDPSAARLEIGYDPFIGNPYGRTYKLAVTKKF